MASFNSPWRRIFSEIRRDWNRDNRITEPSSRYIQQAMENRVIKGFRICSTEIEYADPKMLEKVFEATQIVNDLPFHGRRGAKNGCFVDFQGWKR